MAKFSKPLQFHESAVKVDLNRPVTGSLLKRIRNGKKAKS
ncbi:excisionase [Escherichia coli]|nr:excisionase [Escherichia coli]